MRPEWECESDRGNVRIIIVYTSNHNDAMMY
jgi:hypothetical protein